MSLFLNNWIILHVLVGIEATKLYEDFRVSEVKVIIDEGYSYLQLQAWGMTKMAVLHLYI